MELLSHEGFGFILRWLHVFFGIIWIGLLYYFNFVHGAFMAEAEAATKPGVLTKLLPRAMWWFRWGAMWTMVIGLLMWGMYMKQYYSSDTGWTTTGIIIAAGSLLGFTMWANVWFIIWPAQKIVIASATQVASGGQPLPEVAAAGPRALLASRTNVLLSIPMLFFMLGARHIPMSITPESSISCFFLILLVVWLLVEGNAIKGKLGPMTKINGVITSGFVLTAVLYGALAYCL